MDQDYTLTQADMTEIMSLLEYATEHTTTHTLAANP